ncbi:MAG: shikimate kinase [Nitrospirae bacterium]|nr:shikimate kinase [Nitrospirota bacterium]
MKNIILTGFMGTGKTEVGKILSQKLGLVLIDADAEIEKEQRTTITEIFQSQGEAAFRDLESSMIKRLSTLHDIVLSTGGGVVLRQENIDALRKNGTIVCLSASPETILRRTGKNKNRPLLQTADPLQKIKELYEFRKPYYERADIIIDTDNLVPLQVAEEVIKAVKDR